jgi:hypothetical protein
VTVAIAPTTAAEQQTPATASGVILDQTGGALPGVAVTVTDRASGEEFRTVSDGGGRFAFRTLPPAQYALVARLPGFAAAADSLSLTAGASTERVITLALGTIVETISVDCSATRAIGVSEPRNLAAHDPQPRRGGTPVLIEAVFDRVLQTFVPVLSAQTADRAPVRVGGNISAPRRLTFTGPRCPSALPSAEALVIVVGHIGVDGHVSELRVLRTPLAELGELAAAAVREWTFTPTLLNGDPVAITATFQFVFRQ